MLDRIRRVGHRSARGTWQMEFLAPPPTLAPFARRIDAYAERDTDFARRRELPTGRAVLLFNLGGELRIEDAAGNRFGGEVEWNVRGTTTFFRVPPVAK